jgi:hypothetical protein
MKILDFCVKIRSDEDLVFRALRELQKMDAKTLLESSFATWDPWARSLEPVSA